MFALKAFRRDQIVTYYDGELLTKKELLKNYPGKDELAPYAIKIPGNLYIDAAHRWTQPGRFVNAAPLSAASAANVRFVPVLRRNLRDPAKRIQLIACRAIAPGEEVIGVYGPEYPLPPLALKTLTMKGRPSVVVDGRARLAAVDRAAAAAAVCRGP